MSAVHVISFTPKGNNDTNLIRLFNKKDKRGESMNRWII